MEIRHKTVAEMTTTEYNAAFKANYGFDGYMQGELYRCRREGHEGRVILLWDGPDDRVSSLIGWAILTPVRLYGMVAATRYTKRNSKYTVQFWVKRQHRRKGYGKILMNEVKKHDPKPHVFPHDTASAELFSSYNVTTLSTDRRYIRKKPKVA